MQSQSRLLEEDELTADEKRIKDEFDLIISEYKKRTNKSVFETFITQRGKCTWGTPGEREKYNKDYKKYLKAHKLRLNIVRGKSEKRPQIKRIEVIRKSDGNFITFSLHSPGASSRRKQAKNIIIEDTKNNAKNIIEDTNNNAKNIIEETKNDVIKVKYVMENQVKYEKNLKKKNPIKHGDLIEVKENLKRENSIEHGDVIEVKENLKRKNLIEHGDVIELEYLDKRSGQKRKTPSGFNTSKPPKFKIPLGLASLACSYDRPYYPPEQHPSIHSVSIGDTPGTTTIHQQVQIPIVQRAPSNPTPSNPFANQSYPHPLGMFHQQSQQQNNQGQIQLQNNQRQSQPQNNQRQSQPQNTTQIQVQNNQNDNNDYLTSCLDDLKRYGW